MTPHSSHASADVRRLTTRNARRPAPRVARGQRGPGARARLVVHAGVQARHRPVLVQALRPAAGGLDVGDDDQRGRPRRRDALEQPPLAALADQHVRFWGLAGFCIGGRARLEAWVACSKRFPAPYRLVTRYAPWRREQRGQRAAERGQGLLGDPGRERESGGIEHRRRIDDARERLQPGRVAVAKADDDADALGAAERGGDALADGERPVGRHAIRKRVVERNVERDVGERHRVLRLSYSRRASLRSSQAMRLYSGPGLRRRNAGWNVGIRTASPNGWMRPRSLPIASFVRSSACVATLPSERITLGWITLSLSARNGAQAASSSASGLRLPGGRHKTALVIKASVSRERFTDASIFVSSCPARPTNGSPCASSSAPGPSPITTNPAVGLPEPKTTLVRPSHSLPFRQFRSACSWRRRVSPGVIRYSPSSGSVSTPRSR